MEQEYFKGDTFLSTKDKSVTIEVKDVSVEKSDIFYIIKIKKENAFLELEKNVLNQVDFNDLLDFYETILIKSGID